MPDRIDLDASAIPGRETFPPAGEDWMPAPFGAPLGAHLLDGNRCEFRVWAPNRERVEVQLLEDRRPRLPERGQETNDETTAAGEGAWLPGRRVALTKTADGYHEAIVDDCGEGTRYLFVLDGGNERPDPASRLQPDGVHRASAIVGSDFEWHDHGWQGIALEDYVIYELHVGTFTAEGTFDAVIEHLDSLKELGVTVIELLPIAQFPGDRNWGYDGVYVGAAQASYGGPRALKRLVDACHVRRLAIVLDVVYNHLGPEGNYLSEYGPYFTDRYKTPWGLALNFDGPESDHVRWFFIHNALQWIEEFHFDGLRVDAVHAIVDHSAEPFLQDLNRAVHARAEQLGRRVYSIAESDLNDPRVILGHEHYGLDFDSQWADDYHHSLHTLLTGEQNGYYESFPVRASNLARVMSTGYLYTGQHSPYRGRKYGATPRTRSGAQFVISAQNHDQVGNRMLGERLASIVSAEQLRLAAAAIVLAPFIPMLFMGEEYGEKAPFQYFTSHSDHDLIEAVRRGRREEFEEFAWEGEPPDPHDEATFVRSKLNWSLLAREEHASLRRLYRQLLALRRDTPALRRLDLDSLQTHADDERQLLAVRRWAEGEQVLLAFNFGEKTQALDVPFPPAGWRAMIDTGAKVEASRITLPPHSFAVWSAAV